MIIAVEELAESMKCILINSPAYEKAIVRPCAPYWDFYCLELFRMAPYHGRFLSSS